MAGAQQAHKIQSGKKAFSISCVNVKSANWLNEFNCRDNGQSSNQL